VPLSHVLFLLFLFAVSKGCCLCRKMLEMPHTIKACCQYVCTWPVFWSGKQVELVWRTCMWVMHHLIRVRHDMIHA